MRFPVLQTKFVGEYRHIHARLKLQCMKFCPLARDRSIRNHTNLGPTGSQKIYQCQQVRVPIDSGRMLPVLPDEAIHVHVGGELGKSFKQEVECVSAGSFFEFFIEKSFHFELRNCSGRCTHSRHVSKAAANVVLLETESVVEIEYEPVQRPGL